MSVRIAVSNISLDDAWDRGALTKLAALGFVGLEVAPSKIFPDTRAIRPAAVAEYRESLSACGLECVGLHSLFYDRPELGLFEPGRQAETVCFIETLAHVCADLGGEVMVLGSPSARRLNGMASDDADLRAAEVLNTMGEKVLAAGVSLLIEPLPTTECEYIHDLRHALAVVRMADSSGVAAHFDAKSMFAAADIEEKIVREALPHVRHCHVNEMDLGILRSIEDIHRPLGALLSDVGYSGWISLEQRVVDKTDIFGPLAQSLSVIRECYR
ncbi:MAG: sugar phosphate isomerase/epimerase family protein [Pseudomonadota bacterium]